MSIKPYLKKTKKEVRTLNVWDIDDTLGKTDARVVVKKDGKEVKTLNPGEYNTYKLKDGESFDFAQFRSGKVFRETFKPISTVLDRAKDIVRRQSENSKSIILTARSDFEDHKEFLETFRDNGFPIDRVYVERAGNIAKLKANSPAHINKAVILKRYMKSGNFDRVRMWDDHEDNLRMLFKVAAQFPNIEAVGYLVKDNRVTKYTPPIDAVKKTIKESIRNSKYGIKDRSDLSRSKRHLL